jgi:hypothetical protein
MLLNKNWSKEAEEWAPIIYHSSTVIVIKKDKKLMDHQ